MDGAGELTRVDAFLEFGLICFESSVDSIHTSYSHLTCFNAILGLVPF